MESVKDSIQQRLDKIKYNYQLLFHPDKIKMPEGISEKEKNRYIKRIYTDKAKIHKKIGKNMPIFKNYVKFCLKKVVNLV